MLNTTARQNTTPRTVLVVEDEPTLATAIAQRITAEGWTARVAGDGASAVQAASQLRPDLVIMDIMLPVMDGLEATKRIVAERPVPVLILTARDDEADKVIGLGAGADDYMTKPFSMRELIARCKALLRRVERAKVIAKNSENEKLLDFGSIVIDPAQRIVTVNGEEVQPSALFGGLLGVSLPQGDCTVTLRYTLPGVVPGAAASLAALAAALVWWFAERRRSQNA